MLPSSVPVLPSARGSELEASPPCTEVEMEAREGKQPHRGRTVAGAETELGPYSCYCSVASCVISLFQNWMERWKRGFLLACNFFFFGRTLCYTGVRETRRERQYSNAQSGSVTTEKTQDDVQRCPSGLASSVKQA